MTNNKIGESCLDQTLKVKDNNYCAIVKSKVFSTAIPEAEPENYSDEHLPPLLRLINKIADRSLATLNEKNPGIFIFPSIDELEDLEKKQKILESHHEKDNDYYKTSNLMGFVGSNDGARLTISSRFSNSDNDYFLQYLLAKVFNIPNLVDLNIDFSTDGGSFNLLMFMFAPLLEKTLNKGIYKTYITREYNDANVKGVINVARHIRQNIPFMGKIAYSQREFSYDNPVTQLIRHTIEYIKMQPFGEDLLNSRNDIVKAIIEVTPSYQYWNRQKVLIINEKSPVRSGHFAEYRDLQRLCIQILRGLTGQIQDASESVYGIIFDGAWLWEEYINIVINNNEALDVDVQNRSENNFAGFYHPKNRKRENADKLFGTGLESSSYIQAIYPDFISRSDKPRIIADAKYKPNKNIKKDDYYQVLTYMYRYNALAGLFLHPKDNDNQDVRSKKSSVNSTADTNNEDIELADDTQLFLLGGTNFEGNVKRRNEFMVKLAFDVPGNCETVSSFEVAMHNSEEDFLKKVKDYINVALTTD